MADNLSLRPVEQRRLCRCDRPATEAVCGRLPIHVLCIPASGADTSLESWPAGVSGRLRLATIRLASAPLPCPAALAYRRLRSAAVFPPGGNAVALRARGRAADCRPHERRATLERRRPRGPSHGRPAAARQRRLIPRRRPMT